MYRNNNNKRASLQLKTQPLGMKNADLREELDRAAERTHTVAWGDADEAAAPGTPDPNKRSRYKDRQSIMMNTADIDQTVRHLERFQQNRSAGDGHFRPSRRLKLELGQVLTLCLRDVAQLMPRDPIEFMAHWLYKYIDAELYFYEKIIFNQECMLLVLDLQRRQTTKQKLVQQINNKMKELKLLILNSKVAEAKIIASRVNDAIKGKKELALGEAPGEGVGPGGPTTMGQVDMQMFTDIARGCDELIEATPVSSSDDEDAAWLEGAALDTDERLKRDARRHSKVAWEDRESADISRSGAEDKGQQARDAAKKTYRKYKKQKDGSNASDASESSAIDTKMAQPDTEFDKFYKTDRIGKRAKKGKRVKDSRTQSETQSETDLSKAAYDEKADSSRKYTVAETLIKKKPKERTKLKNYQLSWGKEGGKLTLLKSAHAMEETTEDETSEDEVSKKSSSKQSKGPVGYNNRRMTTNIKRFLRQSQAGGFDEARVKSLTQLSGVREGVKAMVKAKHEKQAAAKQLKQAASLNKNQFSKSKSAPIEHTNVILDNDKTEKDDVSLSAPVKEKMRKVKSETVSETSETTPSSSASDLTSGNVVQATEKTPNIGGKPRQIDNITKSTKATKKPDPPQKEEVISKSESPPPQAAQTGKKKKKPKSTTNNEDFDVVASLSSSNDTLYSNTQASSSKKSLKKPTTKKHTPGEKSLVYTDKSPLINPSQTGEKDTNSAKDNKNPDDESIPGQADRTEGSLSGSDDSAQGITGERGGKKSKSAKKEKGKSSKSQGHSKESDSTGRGTPVDMSSKSFGQSSKKTKDHKRSTSQRSPGLSRQESRSKTASTSGSQAHAAAVRDAGRAAPSSTNKIKKGPLIKNDISKGYSDAEEKQLQRSTIDEGQAGIVIVGAQENEDKVSDDILVDTSRVKKENKDTVDIRLASPKNKFIRNEPTDSPPLKKSPGPNVTGFGFLGAKSLITKTSTLGVAQTPGKAKISQLGVAMATDMMTSAVASLLNLSTVNENEKTKEIKNQRKIIKKATDRFDDNTKGKPTGSSKADSLFDFELANREDKDKEEEKEDEELKYLMHRVKLMRKGHIERKESLMKIQSKTIQTLKVCVSDIMEVGKDIKDRKESLAKLQATLSKQALSSKTSGSKTELRAYVEQSQEDETSVKSSEGRLIKDCDDKEPELVSPSILPDQQDNQILKKVDSKMLPEKQSNKALKKVDSKIFNEKQSNQTPPKFDSKILSNTPSKQNLTKVDTKMIREKENEILTLEHERDEKLKILYKTADKIQHEYNTKKAEVENMVSDIRLKTADVRKYMEESELSEISVEKASNLVRELDEYVMGQKISNINTAAPDVNIDALNMKYKTKKGYRDSKGQEVNIFPGEFSDSSLVTQDTELASIFGDLGKNKIPRTLIKKSKSKVTGEERRSEELDFLRTSLSIDQSFQEEENDTEDYYLIRALAKLSDKSVNQVAKAMKKERNAILGAAARTVTSVTTPPDFPSYINFFDWDKKAPGKAQSKIPLRSSSDRVHARESRLGAGGVVKRASSAATKASSALRPRGSSGVKSKASEDASTDVTSTEGGGSMAEMDAPPPPQPPLVQWYLLPEKCRLVCAHSALGRLGAHKPIRFCQAMNPTYWEESDQSENVFYHHDLYSSTMGESYVARRQNQADTLYTEEKFSVKRKTPRSSPKISPRSTPKQTPRHTPRPSSQYP